MNAKENALEAIRFGRPERVPSGLPCRRITYLGCDHQGYEGGGHHLPVGSKWTDIWGTVWHREHEGVMGFPRGNPLADFPRAMKGYRWPDPDDERIVSAIYEQADAFHQEANGELFLMGAHRDTLWEKSYMLVGMENVMCAFFTEPGAVRDMLHRIMDFQLGIAKHYAAAGVEVVALGDDLGMQTGPLLSLELVREFLVPEYRRLFEFHRSRGTLVTFHSCGHVMHLLETFIELGVDVLNPIQATANDLPEIRRVTQGRMALSGAVNSDVIMDGPPERITRLVRRRLWQLGRKGGYICGPDQGLPWPEEHFQAVRAAVEEHGGYPIGPPDADPIPSAPHAVEAEDDGAVRQDPLSGR